MDIKTLYQIYRKHPEVCIDSRKVKGGNLFFAIRGDRFDGNRFAPLALEAGAAYAVVDDPHIVKDDRYVLVENTLTALQGLASYHRKQFSIPVIGITGSNGKTTTKELLSAVLGTHYRIHFTKGNLNNHIGVPLTLLAMPENTEVAVIEMGANHQREIYQLCTIAQPTHGLITNIGKAHLEGFGGLEGVKIGKGEMYLYLAEHKGIAFIDADEPHLTAMAEHMKSKIFYTQHPNPSTEHIPFEVKLLGLKPFVSVAFLDEKGHLLEAESRLIGKYNFSNIKTAVSLGKYFKVPGAKIKMAIEQYVPSNNRSQIVKKDGNVFILDAYNANPSSMQQALLHFHEMDGAPKVAILGDMLELGETSYEEHRSLAAFALTQSFDRVLLVGKEFKTPARELGLLHFDDVHQLKEWFVIQDFSNTFFLIKASRGIGLEKLVMDLG